MTLGALYRRIGIELAAHPEYADLDVVVFDPDTQDFDTVKASAAVRAGFGGDVVYELAR